MKGTPDHSMLARSLYLEMRSLDLEVRVDENPDGEFSDYRLSVIGLERMNTVVAGSVRRRVCRSQMEIVELVLTRRDPDLKAIRAEGNLRE